MVRPTWNPVRMPTNSLENLSIGPSPAALDIICHRKPPEAFAKAVVDVDKF